MEKEFMGNDHVTPLKSIIESSKRNLRVYSETIDTVIAGGSKGGGAPTITYLFALSELAKSYSQYNLEDNSGQLINFFTILETISAVQNGILRKEQLERQFDERKKELRIEYAIYNTILEKSTDLDSYYPGAFADYERRLQEILATFGVLYKQHKLRLSRCKEMIYPTELLQRKNNKPYFDKEGNEFSSIIDYVDYVSELQETLQSSNGSAKKITL